MQIEAGKIYRTRTGAKMGPFESVDGRVTWFDKENNYRWSDGRINKVDEMPGDLIGAWDGPVRIVERKEIVPGEYGLVTVWPDHGPQFCRVSLGSARRMSHDFTADDMRQISAVFLELADALEGK